MSHRVAPRFVAVLAVLTSIASFGALVGSAPVAGAAGVTTHTPVMGPNLLNAAQLASWYKSVKGSTPPNVPSLHNDVQALAQTFIEQGRVEGVRGDIAFTQSILETGWFSFTGSQVPPDANNFSGIHAFDGRAGLANCKHGDSVPSRCFATAAKGVQAQIQLLRSYADSTTTTLSGRVISAPSDRVGAAPIWEYFGGSDCPCGKLIWASAAHYGVRILQIFSAALVFNGVNAACVPYAPGNNAHSSGSGYWVVTSDSRAYSIGSAKFYGDTSNLRLNQPLIGGEPLSNGKGYWLLALDGGIFSYGGAQFHGSTGAVKLNQPINGMERTSNDKGYWLVAYDGGIFSFGNANFYGSTGGTKLNQPVLGMERTASGRGYWLFAKDGGIFSFGDANFYGSLGAKHLASPVVAMQRTATGRGYWMLTANGQVFAFGDARRYGDIAGCTNYGGANRLLVSPSGHGYWIETADGSVIAFGDARRLGFPARIGGQPVALMLAK